MVGEIASRHALSDEMIDGAGAGLCELFGMGEHRIGRSTLTGYSRSCKSDFTDA